MGTLGDSIEVYRQEMKKGTIPQAYRGIMDLMRSMNISMQKEFPDNKAGALYQGYMDMSFFTSTPKALLEKKLKIAVVFLHESLSLEIWLTAFNRKLQKMYWDEFKKDDWTIYRLQPDLRGKDAILEYRVLETPDFDDPEGITEAIRKGLQQFSSDMISYLKSP